MDLKKQLKRQNTKIVFDPLKMTFFLGRSKIDKKTSQRGAFDTIQAGGLA